MVLSTRPATNTKTSIDDRLSRRHFLRLGTRGVGAAALSTAAPSVARALFQPDADTKPMPVFKSYGITIGEALYCDQLCGKKFDVKEAIQQYNKLKKDLKANLENEGLLGKKSYTAHEALKVLVVTFITLKNAKIKHKDGDSVCDALKAENPTLDCDARVMLYLTLLSDVAPNLELKYIPLPTHIYIKAHTADEDGNIVVSNFETNTGGNLEAALSFDDGFYIKRYAITPEEIDNKIYSIELTKNQALANFIAGRSIQQTQIPRKAFALAYRLDPNNQVAIMQLSICDIVALSNKLRRESIRDRISSRNKKPSSDLSLQRETFLKHQAKADEIISSLNSVVAKLPTRTAPFIYRANVNAIAFTMSDCMPKYLKQAVQDLEKLEIMKEAVTKPDKKASIARSIKLSATNLNQQVASLKAKLEKLKTKNKAAYEQKLSEYNTIKKHEPQLTRLKGPEAKPIRQATSPKSTQAL